MVEIQDYALIVGMENYPCERQDQGEPSLGVPTIQNANTRGHLAHLE